jgi:hypothetical protein
MMPAPRLRAAAGVLMMPLRPLLGFLSLAALLLVAPAEAQVSSVGRGMLTLMVGEGSGPFGNLADSIVAGNNNAGSSSKSGAAWRVVGGYQFFEYLGAEAGIAQLTHMNTRAPYLGVDQIDANAVVQILEVDLVAHVPIAQMLRVDLSAGANVNSLQTSVSTEHGSAVPFGQNTAVDVRRYGFDAGADLELRVSDHTSLIAGVHLYPKVGSSLIVGSARGTAEILGAGVHFEF